MKKRIRALGLVSFLTVLCWVMIAWTPAEAQTRKKIVLKGGSPWGESHRNSIALAYFAKRLEDLSKGDMTMKIFYAGSIVKGPTEIDSIKNGIVDVGTVTLPYHPGAIPESVRIAVMVPFVSDFDSWLWLAKNTDWFRGFLTKLNLQPLYYAHAELVFTMVSPIEDMMNPSLKGRKVRAPGLGFKEVINYLGGDTVTMPSAEAPAALATGLAQGLYTTLDTWEAEGLQGVCPYVYLLHTPFTSPHCMSVAGYKKLPDWARQIVDQASDETAKYMIDWARNYRKSLQDKYKGHAKVQMIVLTEPQMSAWSTRLKPFYGWMTEKYPEMKKYLEDCQQAWRATHKTPPPVVQ
jgi:TRAP-type C4-dicarboxylate transport system substrate-binding protein